MGSLYRDVVAGLEHDGGAGVERAGKVGRGQGDGLVRLRGERVEGGVQGESRGDPDGHPSADGFRGERSEEGLMDGVLSGEEKAGTGREAHEAVLGRRGAAAVEGAAGAAVDPGEGPGPGQAAVGP
jgi:hypothetical protein